MMMSPECYYEEYIKNKSEKEILSKIRSLKREIGHLKRNLENPMHVNVMNPSDEVKLHCYREYLERTKLALLEKGMLYEPTKEELRSMMFDDNISNISRIIVSRSNYLSYRIRNIITVKDNEVTFYEEDLLDYESSIPKALAISKESFLECLYDLHIGEWRRDYSLNQYGMQICDREQWSIIIEYHNNIKPVIIEGDNCYPYNYDELMELLGIEL